MRTGRVQAPRFSNVADILSVQQLVYPTMYICLETQSPLPPEAALVWGLCPKLSLPFKQASLALFWVTGDPVTLLLRGIPQSEFPTPFVLQFPNPTPPPQMSHGHIDWPIELARNQGCHGVCAKYSVI